ncbi:MAG: hypothetical protein H8D32_00115, partial [Dehalococcoidia bacterium]|nr:hypothetical protein [Dehalococcoidia bacterium]
MGGSAKARASTLTIEGKSGIYSVGHSRAIARSYSMDTNTTTSLGSQTLASRPGVIENPNGGYHVHVRLNERGTAAGSLLGPRASMPPGTPVLAEMSVFEDCVLLALQDGDAIVLHVSAPEVTGSVVYFYHADGTLWRAVPLEQLNPGWVCSTYCFRGDLRKFEARLERMRSRPA